jgi:hypothetical protein
VSTVTHCFEHAGFEKQPIAQTKSAEFNEDIRTALDAFQFFEEDNATGVEETSY